MVPGMSQVRDTMGPPGVQGTAEQHEARPAARLPLFHGPSSGGGADGDSTGYRMRRERRTKGYHDADCDSGAESKARAGPFGGWGSHASIVGYLR